MAASPGFEPRYQHPECRVLPLDDEALNALRYLLSFLKEVKIFFSSYQIFELIPASR